MESTPGPGIKSEWCESRVCSNDDRNRKSSSNDDNDSYRIQTHEENNNWTGNWDNYHL